MMHVCTYLHNSRGIDGKHLEGIHRDKDGGDVGVYVIVLKSNTKIVKNGSLTELRHFHHVFYRLQTRLVDRLHLQGFGNLELLQRKEKQEKCAR